MLLPSALGFSPHPPVSVYGTGMMHAIAAFLGTWLTRFPYFCSVHITSSDCTADFPTTLLPRLYAAFHSAPVLSTCVPTVLMHHSTGISTCCPSATSFDLALAPTSPEQISFTLETLDIRPEGFPPSSRYSFRHSLFNKLHSSFRYCFAAYSMLLYQPFGSSASAPCFSPGHFRRRTSRPVSYYALFECVAASEPTSWLSLKSHILFHLTRTWGP